MAFRWRSEHLAQFIKNVRLVPHNVLQSWSGCQNLRIQHRALVHSFVIHWAGCPQKYRHLVALLNATVETRRGQKACPEKQQPRAHHRRRCSACHQESPLAKEIGWCRNRRSAQEAQADAEAAVEAATVRADGEAATLRKRELSRLYSRKAFVQPAVLKFASTSTCADNASFRDSLGYGCAAWASDLPCSTIDSRYGNYDASDQASIKANCPVTCGACTPAGPNGTVLKLPNVVEKFLKSHCACTDCSS